MAKEKVQETPKDQVQLARDQMGKLFGDEKATQLDTGKGAKVEDKKLNEKDVVLTGASIEQEILRTNDSARADVMAVAKEGKRFNPGVPVAGIDDWKGLVEALRGGMDEHFATVWQGVDTGTDKYFFMMIRDKTKTPNEQFFMRKGTDFSIKEKTLLNEVTDEKFKELTGKTRADVKKEEEKKKA